MNKISCHSLCFNKFLLNLQPKKKNKNKIIVKNMRKENKKTAMLYEAPQLSVVEVMVERGFAGSDDEFKFLLGSDDADEDGMIY